jgi:hypothetical protein
MGIITDPPVHVLVVTGPLRERLCERFGMVYFGRHDVRVVMDRRMGERRRSDAGAAAGRRRGERRTSAPWLVFPPR